MMGYLKTEEASAEHLQSVQTGKMENKINLIMEKDMTKHEEAGSAMTEEKDYMEKRIGNAGEELSKTGETCFNCDMCVYKCNTEKTILKHMNTKHEGYMYCNICSTKFRSSETLSVHTANAHKSRSNSKEILDCGHWICMEETGSYGGFCAYAI